MASRAAKTPWRQPIAPSTAVAIGIHLIIIFGLGFSIDFPSDSERTVAVTVALKPSVAPKEAKHVAAQDQLGELESAHSSQVRAVTSLTISSEDEGIGEAEFVERNEKDDRRQSEQQQNQTISDADNRNSQRLGAVAARRTLDAAYLARWRMRVEQIGNSIFSQITQTYGEGDVRLMVSVRSDGTLVALKILKSSGKPGLDRAALATVRGATPFPPFPKELAAQTKRLDIVRTWQFREQRVSSG